MTNIQPLKLSGLSDMLAYIDQHPPVNDTNTSAQHNSPSHTWDFCLGYEGALKTAANGGHWPEGTDRMLAAQRLQPAPTTRQTAPAPTLAPAGSSPHVAAFLTGDPRNMRRQQPRPRLIKPVIKMAANIGVASAVTASDRANVGAAYLTVVTELEQAGYRVQLDAVWLVGAGNTNRQKVNAKWMNMQVTVKNPDQPFNPATAAFLLCHPAVTRRLGFAIAERVHTWEPTVSAGYGRCTPANAATNNLKARYDIYTDTLYDQKWLHSPRLALEHIRELAKKAIGEISQ